MSALQQSGLDKGEAFAKGRKYLLTFKPGAKAHAIEVAMHYSYGHYYAAQALVRAGSKERQEWYTAIRDELLRPNGTHNEDGSWKGVLSPHYDTAMALLILQAPNSHLQSMNR